MQKIRKGDNVIVITGRDKGRTGKVILVLPEENKVKVESINMIKKTVKPNPREGKPGGIVEKEAFIHLSNVAILNPVSKKADKVKIKLLSDGKKVRHYKSNDEMIDI